MEAAKALLDRIVSTLSPPQQTKTLSPKPSLCLCSCDPNSSSFYLLDPISTVARLHLLQFVPYYLPEKAARLTLQHHRLKVNYVEKSTLGYPITATHLQHLLKAIQSVIRNFFLPERAPLQRAAVGYLLQGALEALKSLNLNFKEVDAGHSLGLLSKQLEETAVILPSKEPALPTSPQSDFKTLASQPSSLANSLPKSQPTESLKVLPYTQAQKGSPVPLRKRVSLEQSQNPAGWSAAKIAVIVAEFQWMEKQKNQMETLKVAVGELQETLNKHEIALTQNHWFYLKL